MCFLQSFVSRLNLQPGQVVLDVGCGIGGSAFYMVKVCSARTGYMYNNNNTNNILHLTKEVAL